MPILLRKITPSDAPTLFDLPPVVAKMVQKAVSLNHPCQVRQGEHHYAAPPERPLMLKHLPESAKNIWCTYCAAIGESGVKLGSEPKSVEKPRSTISFLE